MLNIFEPFLVGKMWRYDAVSLMFHCLGLNNSSQFTRSFYIVTSCNIHKECGQWEAALHVLSHWHLGEQVVERFVGESQFARSIRIYTNSEWFEMNSLHWYDSQIFVQLWQKNPSQKGFTCVIAIWNLPIKILAKKHNKVMKLLRKAVKLASTCMNPKG